MGTPHCYTHDTPPECKTWLLLAHYRIPYAPLNNGWDYSDIDAEFCGKNSVSTDDVRSSFQSSAFPSFQSHGL